MKSDAKFIIGVCIVTIAILFGGVFFLSGGQQKVNGTVVDETILTRNAKHTIASDSAKITLVEFADFQCPACQSAHPVLKQIVDEYKGEIRFIYRHFPLPQHKNAVLAAKAAEAAEAVGGQEKFWAMSDLLYDMQVEWSESTVPMESFTNYAKELGLNVQSFSQAIGSDAYDSIIQKDKNDGIALGVNSTPTVFINSKKIEGALTYQNLKYLIDSELKK